MTEHKLRLLPKAAIAAAAILSMAIPQTMLGADTSAEEIQLLREQIAMLQQRLDAIEARETAAAEKAEADKALAATSAATKAEPAPDSVKVSLGSKGLALTTQDKQYSMNITARIQADAHFFPDSDDGKNEFYFRRAIVTFKGNAGRAKWLVSPNFAGSTVIEDAWVGIDLGGGAFLNAGKITSLEGLENYRSNAKILFSERSLANNLTPGREVGMKLEGKLNGKQWGYGLSITNGALDSNGANNNANLSDDFLFSGLVSFTPFANDKESMFSGLTFGLAASYGDEETSLTGATDRAISFKTAGRNTFLSIQTGTLIDGERYRVNPQLTWYQGSFGLLSEYIASGLEMSRGGVGHKIRNQGWTIEASYVLTGEKNSFGGVTPAQPFDFGKGGWGAFEVGMRYNAFEADKDLFTGDSTTLLATTSSAQKAEAIGAMFKWHLTQNLLWGLNYEVTQFSGLGADKDDEQVITSRMQINF